MPTKNSRKVYVPDSYYHVYSRGINKQEIFKEEADYSFFISLFKRYLSKEIQISRSRVTYPNFNKEISLLAYTLMPNHIHMLVYQAHELGIKKLMQSVMTSYSMYFNQKYSHFGPVFQGRYLASMIDNDQYLEHISRYIHLNPKDYQNYPYSSLQFYAGSKKADWIDVSKIMNMFSSYDEYVAFLEDHKDFKAMLEEIEYELANC